MSYRDDLEALRVRHELLAQKLHELEGKADELEALRREEAETRRQLRETEAHLAESEQRKRLPVLEDLKIASPCHARWDDMRGDERSRHCGQCDKQVYNLSSMSRAEAERLVFATEGRVCVRFYRRADGTVLTSDCPVGLKYARRKRAALALVGGGAIALAAAGTFAALTTTGSPVRDGVHVMGDSAMPAQPAPIAKDGKPEPIEQGQMVMGAAPAVADPPQPVVRPHTMGHVSRAVQPREP